PADDPVRAAYALFPGPGKDRESWDETAVLAAVRGPEACWNVHATGSNSVNPRTGANRWLEQPARRQAYLVERDAPERVAKTIGDLMVAPPRLGRSVER